MALAAHSEQQRGLWTAVVLFVRVEDCNSRGLGVLVGLLGSTCEVLISCHNVTCNARKHLSSTVMASARFKGNRQLSHVVVTTMLLLVLPPQVFPWVLQLCDKAVHHVTSSSSSSSTADGKPGPAAAAAAAASIDVEDLAKRFTADVIGHMLFAEDLKSMDMG